MLSLTLLLLIALLCGVVTASLRPPKEWDRRLKWQFGIKTFQPCPYVDDPPTAVFEELSRAIVGQESAILNITDDIDAWHRDHLNGRDRPLVLVFAGATGIGKSETAKAIARSLLTGRVSMPGALGRTKPEGELHLDGGYFKVDDPGRGGKEHEEGGSGGRYSGTNITTVRTQLRDDVAQLLYECHGNGVVILDESQKIPKSVLAPLSSLFRGEAAVISHPDAQGGQLSAARMVLIVISDTGVAETSSFVTDVYSNPALLTTSTNGPGAPGPARPKRVDLAHSALASKMRMLINKEFEEGAFDLGQLADSITTFMPIGQDAARALLHHLLLKLGSAVSLRQHAHTLTWTSAFVDILTTPKYSKYNMHEPGSNNTASRCHAELATQLVARKRSYSTRQDGGPGQGSTTGEGEAEKDGHQPTVCGEPCDVPRVCYLPGGARGLESHAEDAWKRFDRTLRSALKQVPAARQALIRAYGTDVHIMSDDDVSGKISRRNDLLAKTRRATGSVASLFTGQQDPAIKEAVQDAAARRQAAVVQEGEHGGLPRGGETVPAGTPAAARLHLDVSCEGHVPDGACFLRGVSLRFTRCLGRPELVQAAAFVDENGNEIRQGGRSSSSSSGSVHVGEEAESATVDIDARTGETDAHHPPGPAPHEQDTARRAKVTYRPAVYAWKEQCDVIYEGDIQ